MLRIIVAIIAISTVIGLGSINSASATPTYCGITWGSTAKTAYPAGDIGTLTDIRTGRHTCYDRMVLDIPGGNAIGYDVRYVSNVHADGSGDLIPLNGGAKLRIVANTPSYDPHTGTPTYPGIVGQPLPGVNLTGYETFRDAKFAGSFEGQTTVGLGVRAQLPMRVFELSDRLVIDVAHRWY
jgi:hypothetical protein